MDQVLGYLWRNSNFNVFLVAGELPVYLYTSSDLEIVIIKLFQIIIEKFSLV